MSRYEKAAHRMQSAIAFDMTKRGLDSDGLLGNFRVEPRAENVPLTVGATLTHRLLIKELKDHRVAIDSAMASQEGLARLFIDKGLFTIDEYQEAMEGAMEREADRRCEFVRKEWELPDGVIFE